MFEDAQLVAALSNLKGRRRCSVLVILLLEQYGN